MDKVQAVQVALLLVLLELVALEALQELVERLVITVATAVCMVVVLAGVHAVIHLQELLVLAQSVLSGLVPLVHSHQLALAILN